MRRTNLTLAAVALAATGIVLAAAAPAGAPRYLNQGDRWGATERASFYTMDQGSELIPLAWARALRTPSGDPFLGDHLTRYGYLPINVVTELPIGFVAADRGGVTRLGMTVPPPAIPARSKSTARRSESTAARR